MIELIGWIAAGLTLTAYSMKTMLPLRAVAVAANCFFIVYGALAEVYPALFLHLCLLPLNTARLIELIRQTRKVKQAIRDDSPLDWLRPLLKPTNFKDGDYVFRKGERPDNIYFLEKGVIVLEELDLPLEAGQLFGEMAFFTDARERTVSARCEGGCSVMAIDEASFMRLYYQNPAFGFYIVKLIARRLLEGMEKAPDVYAPVDPPVDPKTASAIQRF